MDETFDGLILGTGHNALVLQAYLSRLGLRTLALDRARHPGGGLSTIDNPRLPGFVHNPHAFFHRAITEMPWFKDLQLAERVQFIEPDLNVALIRSDGRSLQWWTDLERTASSVAQFSRKDAVSLRTWAEEFRPIVETILIPEAQSPPLTPALRTLRLQQSRLGRRLLEVSRRSPLDFVTEEFENDFVRVGLLFFNGLREVDLRLRGFGHAIPALLASTSKAQMCVGGSVNLARALVADIEEHGGQVRCGVTLKSMLWESGRVCGVELSSGERLGAERFIASGLNPQQTFLELLPARALPAGMQSQAQGFQYNQLAPLFGLHLALKEPPRYQATDIDTNLSQAFMVILGLDGLAQFHQMVRAHERQELPPPIVWGACPTIFDASQAPAGRHTAFLWEKVPYALRGNPDSWAEEAENHGNDLLKFWARFAPNLTEHTILDRFVTTPADTFRDLPNMRYGDLLVGSFDHGQVGANRPFAGAGCYRTPINGLYLCGGSTHPGGNITGLCGYNASRVIAADLGVSG